MSEIEEEERDFFTFLCSGKSNENFAEGERRGIQIGILEGSRKKAEETARSAIKMGLSIEQISKLTGLSAEEIQNL